MNTYVISDIHGCYEEFMAMLDKIGFSPADRLTLAGDYVDRGKDSFRMLKWLEQKPENVYAILGNHDEGFARSVELMEGLDRKLGLQSGLDSPQEGLALYESLRYYMKKKGLPGGYFDLYGTIRILLERKGATLRDLYRWAKMFRDMPLCRELKVKERVCVVVHGGYAENPEDVAKAGYSSLEEFYLEAREEAYLLGGKPHGMVVAGHTPTFLPGEFTFNEGRVFRYYDEETDCVFYDIDCGCAYRRKDPWGRLACIRLEDERVFYV